MEQDEAKSVTNFFVKNGIGYQIEAVESTLGENKALTDLISDWKFSN